MLETHGIGNLTRDCNVRHVGERNTPVCTFSVAFNRNFKINDEWKKEVAFVECELWGKRVDKIKDFLTKGQQVVVTGYMVTQSWDNAEKGRQHKLVLKVKLVEIIQRIKNGDNGSEPVKSPVDENALPF